MGYSTLKECVIDLEKNGHLVRIKEQVDPNLEMAAIHLRVFEKNGPAILFENIKGCRFQAVSNLYGTRERSHFIFRDTLQDVKRLIDVKTNPLATFRQPLKNIGLLKSAWNALPRKTSFSSGKWKKINPEQLPQIKCWPMDGGAFITLPQVYTEDIESPGIMNSNLGMYRIQISGNEYSPNEMGLHYQLHRGIGIHQTKAYAKGQPMKVSIFVGGPPAHAFSAVMPLPENISELTFAGVLAGKRFSYFEHEGHIFSDDADFVITGIVHEGDLKPEGPFGDHFGYYSLTHPFPVLQVTGVYHRTNAIWPFTVVGRPPQEDTLFGDLIHDITGKALESEIPGLHEVNAVDAAGVHPLLLAIGSERYTPYSKPTAPAELLTIANHLLGSGQMSLAKYIFIINKYDQPELSARNIEKYFEHVLERVDWKRDVHFQTKTSIDTLDYSGEDLNSGSKVVIAAIGNPIRELKSELSNQLPSAFSSYGFCMKGILAVSCPEYKNEEQTQALVQVLDDHFKNSNDAKSISLIIFCDDAQFTSATLNNFLWVTFTRSNPSHDIHGIDAFTKNKHWGCNGPLIIDARKKPHHAPELVKDERIEKEVDRLGEKGGSLYGII